MSADSYRDEPALAAQIERARGALSDPQAFLALVSSADAAQAKAAALVLRRESLEPPLFPVLTEVIRRTEGPLRLVALERLRWVRDPVVLECVLECLRDGDAAVQRAALDALGSHTSEVAVKALAAALKNFPPESLGAAARGLAKAAGERAVPILVDTLRSGAEPEPILAALAKGVGGAAAAMALRTLYGESSPERRALVLGAMAEVVDPAAVGLFREALRDPDSTVRAAAARALPQCCLRLKFSRDASDWLPQAARDLAAALNDEDAVRKAAAAGLGMLVQREEGDEAAQRVLGEALLEALAHSTAQARPTLVGLLHRTGAPRITDELVACLRDESAAARLAASQIIAATADPAGWAALLPAAGDSDARIRAVAIGGIAALDSPAAEAAVERALRDGEGSVRAAGLHALARRRGKGALAVLLAALSDGDKLVRNAALRAITPFAEVSAVPLILAQVWESRWEAQQALDRVRDLSAMPHVVASIAAGGTGSGLASGWLVNRASPEAKPQLQALLQHASDAVRAAAREALDKIPDPDLILDVARRLTSEASDERWKAVHALWEVARFLPKEAMLAQLGHAEPKVRRVFARFAGYLYGEEAVAALGALRADPDPTVRWWASVAMEQAGAARSPWDHPLGGHLGFAPPPDGAYS